MTNKSPTRVIVKHEEKMSLEQAATLLESIAVKLKEEGTFTLNLGGTSEQITPAKNVELEIELEEKNGKYQLELELEWREGDDASQNQGISIE